MNSCYCYMCGCCFTCKYQLLSVFGVGVFDWFLMGVVHFVRS